MNIVSQTGPDGVVRLALDGELDLDTVEVLRRHVERAVNALQPPHRLVIDLAELTFCDSTGVGALVEARDIAGRRGIPMHVINPQDMPRKVLALTGVLDLLTDTTG